MERSQKECCRPQSFTLKVHGCESLTPYERRALYQVEELALGRSFSINRILSVGGPCKTGLKFHHWKEAGVVNAAHAIEHLVVFCSEKLAQKTGLKGLTLYGATAMEETGTPTITITFLENGKSEEILLKATTIVADAINSRLITKSGHERKISFSTSC